MKTILNLKDSPYGLLLFAAIALSVALLFSPLTNVEFQDITMFGVPLAVMVWMIPLILVTFWVLYLLTRKFLYSMTITRIHIFVTVSAIVLMVCVAYIGIDASSGATDNYEWIGNTMQLLALIFAGIQLAYVANVLLGFFNRQKV